MIQTRLFCHNNFLLKLAVIRFGLDDLLQFNQKLTLNTAFDIDSQSLFSKTTCVYLKNTYLMLLRCQYWLGQAALYLSGFAQAWLLTIDFICIRPIMRKFRSSIHEVFPDCCWHPFGNDDFRTSSKMLPRNSKALS